MVGDFSASALLKIQMKAEQMWADGSQVNEFSPQAEAAKAVLSHQTARFQALDNPEKDNQVSLTWVKSCDVVVEDCESNCDLDEPELETAAKTYEFNICKKTGFSIDREKLRTSTYNREELAARGLAACVKELDEYWAQRILLKLKGFAGVNVFPQPFTFDVARNTTVVPSALYGTPGVFGGLQLPLILQKQAVQNRLKNPYYIDNGRLWLEYYNATNNNGNTDINGAGGVSRARQIDLSFDLFNFGAAGITNATTFAIDRNALAFKTYNRHGLTMDPIGGQVGQTHYSVPSIALQGVRYDVYYTVKCKTINGKAHILDVWRFETNGLIESNPEACPVNAIVNGTPTVVTPNGILTYTSADELV